MRAPGRVLPIPPFTSTWFGGGFQCSAGCAAHATHVTIEAGQRWPVCAEHAWAGPTPQPPRGAEGEG